MVSLSYGRKCVDESGVTRNESGEVWQGHMLGGLTSHVDIKQTVEWRCLPCCEENILRGTRWEAERSVGRLWQEFK